MQVASTILTFRVMPRDELLLTSVRSAAHAANRPVRPLHLQALLQLPRIADECGIVSSAVADSFLTELARELPVQGEWLVPEPLSSPRSLHFHDLDAKQAKDVMWRFHYLRSPRTDGRAYGLSTAHGHLVALCVSSPLDVELFRRFLKRQNRPTETARVVSRVFVFEGAPHNTISYMPLEQRKKKRN